MNTIKHYIKINLSLIFLLMFFSTQTFSQEYDLNNQSSKLTVSGTSSLHDWDIVAEQQKGQLVLDQTNELQLKKLTLEVVAESLKSGKGGMDKNTYKALNIKDYKNITFTFSEAKRVQDLGNGKYKVTAQGNLTVAGVTKKVDIDFNLTLDAGKVTLNGEKSIKMTDFKIDPPKALLGTITTGDEITIKFNTIFTK